MPAELIGILKTTETSMVLKQEGNVIQQTNKVGEQEFVTVVNLDKETEWKEWTGETIKVISNNWKYVRCILQSLLKHSL